MQDVPRMPEVMTSSDRFSSFRAGFGSCCPVKLDELYKLIAGSYYHSVGRWIVWYDSDPIYS